jgi:threonine/homoserine/homoserine lactone efflux protein
VAFASFGPLLIGATHSQRIGLVVAFVVVVVLLLLVMGAWGQRPDGTRWPIPGRYWHIGRLKPDPPKDAPRHNDPSGYDGD